MSQPASLLDVAAAEARLMRYLAVEGVTGREAAIAAVVIEDLKSLGVPAEAIRFDDANERIPLPTETGNLIVTLPGTTGGERIAFSTHLDTVPLCSGAKPIREGDRIRTDGSTALGGDNRTGCTVLVTLVETLLKHNIPHPPLTLLFTVREESGLHGARELNTADLGGAAMCFNFDGKLAADLVIGAVAQEGWQAEIIGKAAHAGVAPEKGISSTLVGAIALTEAKRGGWFGKVTKPEGYGTSNIGVFGGKPGQPAGEATNVVTDYVRMVGEARSPEASFAATISAAYRAAFETARQEVADADGATAEVKFTSKPSYPSFKLPEDSAVVARAKRAVASLGLTPNTKFSNGGLDANWLVNHDMPTVTFGAGQYEIHTVKEYVDLPEFAQGCRLAIALATLAD
ncbi:M20/M25/M40 family metallo-hydrolase [Lacipirellula parvula]|nr:M20/M25/M40 family metallo-hydrolase [Lacipirellula parvula]